MSGDEEFEAHLSALREGFRARLGAHHASLVAYRKAMAVDLDSVSLGEARALAHALVGTAGTFGFEEVSEAAAELESVIDAVLAGEAERSMIVAPLRSLIREVELSL
ncbi:MAG TPA: Hpt domain-containing protein [Microvirga sp.]